MKQWIKYYLIAITIMTMASAAHAEVTLKSVENQYARMSKLINESSGARQVMDSSNAEAKAKRSEAIELHKRARQLIDQKNYADASALLHSSALSIFAAIKLATPKSVMGNKLKDDYAQRRESVFALKDAFDRISDENNERETKQKTDQQVDEIVASADAYLANGKNVVARQELDKAYHLLKVSIENIRAGQTLIRSLNFATAEEEYHYEVDRNDTHNMLVDLLVSEKKKSGYTEDRITAFINEAKLLREQADAHASDKDFEKAIELLEASTRQLVRAIRVAGIFIPG